MAQKTGVMKGRSSIFGHLLIGTVVCVLITLTAAAVCAVVVSKEIVAEDRIGYIAIAILVLSPLVGGIAGSMGNKEKKLHISLIVGVIYVFLLLSMTALFFGGQYQSVGVGIIAVLSGCILSVLLGQKRGKRIKIRRSKNRCR